MGKWGKKKRPMKSKEKSTPANNKLHGKEKDSYSLTWQINRKLEAFYAVQGLHDTYYNETSKTFIACETDAEREAERTKWLDTLRRILPASFRLGQDLDPLVRLKLDKEINEMVGKEMELRIEQKPKRKKTEAEQEAEVVVQDGEEVSTNGVEEVSTEEVHEVIIKTVAPARKIPFVPFAYQLSVDRITIKKNPALTHFHEWLKVQSNAGFVTRQETVSMIPPVVLSVEPHHSVLDMCAAPGSKTSQMLEIVSQQRPGEREPKGCIVANDADPKRAYMLVHQLKRINSPVAFVVSCDAQFFPSLRDEVGEGSFDRVLADVPCSGDGTLRKNAGVWKNWNCLNAYALHSVQLSIALNGARLTKVGGYVCYSTCSMNPIENESVVAELLRLADGALELVDPRPDMPGLLARPGWNTWKVLREEKIRREEKNKAKKTNEKMQAKKKEWEEKQKKEQAELNGNDGSNGVEEESTPIEEEEHIQIKVERKIHVELGPPPSWEYTALKARAKEEGLIEYESFDDVEEQWQKKVRKSCFPPTEEEIARFGLEKCLRCLPHDMDTGGFFVALLKKVKPIGKKAREQAIALARELRPDVVDDEGTVLPDAKRAKVDLEAYKGEETEELDSEEPAMEIEDKTMVKQKIVKQTTVNNTHDKKRTRGDSGNEDFLVTADDIWPNLMEYYGLSDDFPKRQYMSRSKSNSKVLYFVGKPVTDLMDRGMQDRLTIINAGLKGFERNSKDVGAEYRITQESIQFLVPYMTKRKITGVNVKDFELCLETGAIKLETLSDEFAAQIRELIPGSFVIQLTGFEEDVAKKLCMVMWKCRGDAVNCLVSKIEVDGIKSKLRAVKELMGWTDEIPLNEEKAGE